jgi:hypothetical protein
MLGSIDVQYNDLGEEESVEESFDDVESVSVAGAPDELGDSLIIAHSENERSNTVRNGVVLQNIS